MPKCFGALFFRGFTFGQNAKGGGGKVIAKRFGALLKTFYSWIPFKVFLFWAKCPRGGGACQKILEHFFQDVYPFRLSKSAGIKNFFQMSATFLEATNIRIYAVLSNFAKCRDSRIKSAPRLPKIEGGGGSANSGNAHI